MSKLKCVDHDKRVMVLDLGTHRNLTPNTIPLEIPIISVVHRDNGDRCISDTVKFNDEVFEPIDVVNWKDSDTIKFLKDIFETNN